MKRVNIREFNRNFYRIIGEMPLIVIKNNKPWFTVTPYGEAVETDSRPVPPPAVQEKVTEDTPVVTGEGGGSPGIIEAEETDSEELEVCEICRTMKPDVKSVRFLDGEDEVVKQMCSHCAAKIPEDMRIVRAANYTVLNVGKSADLSQAAAPIPKIIKEKKKTGWRK